MGPVAGIQRTGSIRGIGMEPTGDYEKFHSTWLENKVCPKLKRAARADPALV